MGRGLSNLQAYIVHRASGLSHVYYADLLEGYFRLEPTGWYTEKMDGRTVLARYKETDIGRECGQIKGVENRHFSRGQIGKRIYDKAVSSLSRAVQRLVKRGLVTIVSPSNWYRSSVAVKITDKGRDWVKVETTNLTR